MVVKSGTVTVFIKLNTFPKVCYPVQMQQTGDNFTYKDCYASLV